MYEKIKRVRSWFKGRKKGPVSLEINPTNLCNLSCKFCHGFQGGLTQKRSKELNQDICIRAIEEASDLGVKEVHIAGDGEPLMKIPLIMSLVKSIKKHKMLGTLTTNGTLFTPTLLELIVHLKWDIITISLESSDAKIHNCLTGNKNTYKRIIKNIKLLNDYKKRFRTDKPMIKFSVVIMEKNKYKLHKIVELAHKLDTRAVFFEPLVTNNNPKIENFKIKKGSINKLNKEFKKIKALADKYEISTNIDFMDENKKRLTKKLSNSFDLKESQKKLQLYCYQPWYKMVIRPDGKVQPCCNFYDKNAESIYNKGLKKIWFGQHFKEIRDGVTSNKIYQPCKNCNTWIIKENEGIRNALNNNLLANKIRVKEYLRKIYKICIK